MNISPALTTFLKVNGVYEIFIENVKAHQNRMSSTRDWNTKIYDHIIDAFIWNNTPEGEFFWMKLDTKFTHNL